MDLGLHSRITLEYSNSSSRVSSVVDRILQKGVVIGRVIYSPVIEKELQCSSAIVLNRAVHRVDV